MAKKREKKKLELPGKVRVELRFDEDVYERVKAVAEAASVSVNQLCQGVMRWAMANAVIGEPSFDKNGVVKVADVPGCVFFGKKGHYHDAEDRREAEEREGMNFKQAEEGQVYFSLDFTERRVVQEPGPEAIRANANKPRRSQNP